MSFLHVTNQTAGAPPLSPVNGSLCSVLDWALPQAGWTILFSSGFARVYRSQNGRCLHVNHDSALSGDARKATVRGAASASSATVLVNPFPTPAQASDTISYWRIDSSTGGTRAYDIVADSNFLIIAIYQSASRESEVYFFGEVLTDFPDANACVIHVCSSTGAVTGISNQGLRGSYSAVTFASVAQSTINVYWQANVDGSITSSCGFLFGPGFGVTGGTAARGGYENRIFREPVAVGDYGQQSTGTNPPLALAKRGLLPNLWTALHASMGPITRLDTFADSVYDPAAIFKMTEMVIMELTDTWRPR